MLGVAVVDVKVPPAVCDLLVGAGADRSDTPVTGPGRSGTLTPSTLETVAGASDAAGAAAGLVTLPTRAPTENSAARPPSMAIERLTGEMVESPEDCRESVLQDIAGRGR